jgi:hypothetical protein
VEKVLIQLQDGSSSWWWSFLKLALVAGVPLLLLHFQKSDQHLKRQQV